MRSLFESSIASWFCSYSRVTDADADFSAGLASLCSTSTNAEMLKPLLLLAGLMILAGGLSSEPSESPLLLGSPAPSFFPLSRDLGS